MSDPPTSILSPTGRAGGQLAGPFPPSAAAAARARARHGAAARPPQAPHPPSLPPPPPSGAAAPPHAASRRRLRSRGLPGGRQAHRAPGSEQSAAVEAAGGQRSPPSLPASHTKMGLSLRRRRRRRRRLRAAAAAPGVAAAPFYLIEAEGKEGGWAWKRRRRPRCERSACVGKGRVSARRRSLSPAGRPLGSCLFKPLPPASFAVSFLLLFSSRTPPLRPPCAMVRAANSTQPAGPGVGQTNGEGAVGAPPLCPAAREEGAGEGGKERCDWLALLSLRR